MRNSKKPTKKNDGVIMEVKDLESAVPYRIQLVDRGLEAFDRYMVRSNGKMVCYSMDYETSHGVYQDMVGAL